MANFSAMRDAGSTVSAGAFNSQDLDIETPWHFHDLHQVIYAFEGSVEVESETARYKVPHLFAAWIPAGTVHRTAIHRVKSGSVFFSPDMVNIPNNSLRVIAVNSLMREMIMYAMRWPIQREVDATSTAFYDCFAHLCKEWMSDEVLLVLPAAASSRIKAAVNFTRLHLPTVTLEDICAAVGMSPRSLRRNFHKEMGISWEEYRQRLRIYTAVEALDKTDKPVAEIAEYVGYASQSAFSRAFSAFMGIGPAAYRGLRSGSANTGAHRSPP